MRLQPALAVFSFMIPAFAVAGPLDDAVRDAAIFEQVQEQMSLEQSAQDADALREAGDELFPGTGQGSGSSRPVTLEEDPVFLTARVDGVPVIFRDVPKDAWFAPYVRDVVGKGIVSGYRESDGTLKGLFGPDDPLTIAELAKIAVQVALVDLSSCGSGLKNATAAGMWAEPYVRCAERRGWAVYADGSGDVQRLASRAQVVATLLQALGVKIEPRTGGVFRDVDSSVEFAAAVEMAARAGVVSGDADAQGNPTGLFRPVDPVNRAEVAKIVAQAVQIYEY
ncbi:MAG: S-layer protein [Candidatus Peribacter riflensis]|uniref:S-layer protein n=1 Tax=Candidatus Peribacter riflensis TaxID=1735162 RepID=A0A0S1SUU4_9BACT|nr:MAG: S-layer protein [Candidatus Peribacter riflensis]ALM10848.1 MAG: S-layer protein [Candidatus Peribacter riflensis]ALM11950.1 MAG: S-layer protein [Candidatus Peribacter riflensis]ALM13053.1 MAG: S-layer protein [Candidatus Peribacter riflensis]ALM14153.1 MAG: S-layer protein [Candidatus Peribacter riflensis]